MPTTRGVDVMITADLFPEGTVYGGGRETYRYPDAEPVDDTPVMSPAHALDELGSTGAAIRWALARDLMAATHNGERTDDDGDPGQLVDRFEWEGSFTPEQWEEFAALDLLDTDDDGMPSSGEESPDEDTTTLPDGTILVRRMVTLWDDSMAWNVGGLSKVSGTRTEVTLWEMTTA